MSKEAKKIASECNVPVVYENKKGEFFTVENYAVLSEAGVKENVIKHDFTAEFAKEKTATPALTVAAKTADTELETAAKKAGAAAASTLKKQGASKEKVTAAYKAAYEAYIAKAAEGEKTAEGEKPAEGDPQQ